MDGLSARRKLWRKFVKVPVCGSLGHYVGNCQFGGGIDFSYVCTYPLTEGGSAMIGPDEHGSEQLQMNREIFLRVFANGAQQLLRLVHGLIGVRALNRVTYLAPCAASSF